MDWLSEIGAGVCDMMTDLTDLPGLGWDCPGNGRCIQKERDERCSSPVQLSKFLGRDKGDGVRRSAVSGKKILLKLDKTREDKTAENNRNELLKFLNASFD